MFTNQTITPIAAYASMYAYQVYGDGTQETLEVLTECDNGYEFCFKNSVINANAKMYGSPTGTNKASIYIEAIWCDSTNSSCPLSTNYNFGIYVNNLKKDKGG